MDLENGATTVGPIIDELTATAGHSAERRQVTVMFCDLVGSTALSGELDLEDLRDVMVGYHQSIAKEAQAWGGFVAKYMGDGVLIYFGYPQAHEDDPERAVRAALAMTQAAGAIQSPRVIQVRVGIATGMVIVGDLTGTGEAQEHGIIGETPNLAARLQTSAEPGMIVIGPRTRSLLGDLFEFRDLGEMMFKGFAEPLHAYAVVGSSAVESRFDAFHGARLTPLVGRDEEIALIMRRWERAKTGNGQVILISGEAGIGKSRLTAAVLQEVKVDQSTRMRLFCSAHYTNSAFYPIVKHLERAADIGRDDDPEAKFDKLQDLLSQGGATPEDFRLLSDLLALPFTDRYPALRLSPQQRRQRQSELCCDSSMACPSGSRSFRSLKMCIGSIRRVLSFWTGSWSWFGDCRLCSSSRSDRNSARRVGQPHATMITLGRLDERDGTTLIGELAGNRPLSAEIMTEILDRTDGIPLFVEELTKAILEAGPNAPAVATTLAMAGSHDVPTTLHASLMARLDRLGPAKELAQMAPRLDGNSRMNCCLLSPR